MFYLQPRARRPQTATIVSVVCHALVVVLLLVGATRASLNKPQPTVLCCFATLQVAGGSRAPRMQLPEAPAAQHPAKKPAMQDSAARSENSPRERRPAPASGTDAAAAQPADLGTNSVAGNGSDAQNSTPAFPVFSPNPLVKDRSLLPPSEQKVVVDVQLNPNGDVMSENLVKGVGNALDQIVLDVVKTWRFQPATVNGKAVASEAEVIVPFRPSYPISPS